jgi:PAS domain S-box-containing protein
MAATDQAEHRQMNPSSWFGGGADSSVRVLWDDGEHVLCRAWHLGADGNRTAALTMLPVAEHPPPATLDRLAHEYGLKDELDGAWAVRPLALVRERGRNMLVLEDPGGELLEGLLGAPMAVGLFLRLALGLAEAVVRLHQRGLIHKDIKPAHILVDPASGAVRLCGFGIASRLPRERQAPAPPETVAGTLAYMAPEQTGRMNRSVDTRSDLYAVGVTLYRMLTGTLPFTASEPMEWVHCHIAREPVPPGARVPGVPVVLSAIIMKLLAKTAEERYQTAAGLAADLQRCLTGWEADGRIAPFTPGAQDIPDQLRIPEKLYGREREVGQLLAAFGRVVARGRPELVLVAGYSGIGKSSVVNELHKVLVPSRGLFAAGKFDQLKRDVPYATLAQAFQSLIHSLLGQSDTELGRWRDALRDALGPNGQLMVDLVPDLKLIIGTPPPVPELPPQDAQRRFQLVFRRFLGVFASADHPLVLFLDDLQWLDPATLDLLADLLTQPEVTHLLLIGAYRDNEVDAAHPLTRTLDVIRQGAQVQQVTLAPLARHDLGQLVADALHCTPGSASDLAQLLHAKTAGNPFFAIQFLTALADEGLLIFDHDAARWSWDLDRIHAKGYTDNVVDLMVGKLARLPIKTRAALQQLACLGNIAQVTMLSIVHGTSAEELHSDLWEAARLDLIVRLEDVYRFVHDRVQEAAYSLIPVDLRPEAHLRIGRLLAAHTPPARREEAIFEIVNQLNRGAALITEQEECEQLAELNLIAGQRAKASTAYASALTYLTAGADLLPEDSWERRHALTFALELSLGECEFLTGALPEAEQRLAALSTRAADTVEQATVACLRMDLYMTLDQSSHAVAVGLDYLRHLGIEWSAHPTEDEAHREYKRVWSQLGGREIEELVDLPLMTDPSSFATLDVLTKLAPPAFLTDVNLLSLVTCRAVNLSLERGHSDGSCPLFEWLGLVAGARFGDYKAAYRFGELGYELVEQRGLKRFQARTYMLFAAHIIPWAKNLRFARDLLRRAFEAANQMGDLTYAVYSCELPSTNLLVAGDSLVDVQREAEHALAFARKARFGLIGDLIATKLRLIRTLRGLTPKFGSFDDAEFDELRMERRFATNPDLARAECTYLTRKLQARFFSGDYAAAVNASSRAQSLLWTSLTTLEATEYHFYGALSRAGFYGSVSPDQRQQHLDALAAHHRRLEVWAASCPENFGNRAALVGAEIARIEGRVLDAEHLYEQAIQSAQANGFVQNEALAHELAARFYAARGFDRIADLYLRNARYGYLRWGANGKVRQLEELYPQLLEKDAALAPTGTIGAPVEHLDLATVLKVSQAVSGEIVLEKLIDTLMRTAIEYAGAQRGLLIAPRGTEQRIEAEATTRGEIVSVALRDEPMVPVALPESIVHYVLRTGEVVILGDASADTPFSADAYLCQQQVRSILCLPLINQSRLIGVLYLENNLAPRVFTPARIAILKLLASQAAISLENTRLYRDLAEREAKIRRLVDADIIGIFIWDQGGEIPEANDAFLRIVGYDREDLVSGRMRWTDWTPPEWRDQSARDVEELKMTGSLQPYETEYFRKNGTRVPVLVGAAVFEEGGNQGVAFVLDLTERKHAEAEARESERRYREVQMELAHANRVATLGQITASIAHEVNQPIAAAVTNADAALRWLGAQPPDLDETREALGRILQNGKRAGEVIGRIRALVKKSPSRRESVAINDAILEVIALTRGEAAKTRVSVTTALAEDLPLTRGDRVQLQQVILNLIINAVEAMGGTSPMSRKLLISTRRAGSDGILVAVEDSGPGLTPANLEQLFQAFYTTKPGGLGLGLSICRSIIEAHGGRLWVEANEPQGAIFQFTMPVEPGSAS